MRISDWSSDVCSSDLSPSVANTSLPLPPLMSSTPRYLPSSTYLCGVSSPRPAYRLRISSTPMPPLPPPGALSRPVTTSYRPHLPSSHLKEKFEGVSPHCGSGRVGATYLVTPPLHPPPHA